MNSPNLEACQNDPDFTPNVSLVRVQGVRIVRGKIMRAVRNELMAGVNAGKLGHLLKDGLKPEAFFHPNSLARAKDLRNREAQASIEAIAKINVPMSELTTDDQSARLAQFAQARGEK